ncbi:amidohydrolase family protein [Rubrivirga marina]|uniref:Amidohydrolase n=1 Tax=Rubrivirga marina TaxID=1196024 RepID=A0A271IXK9_9BACT|nr:amidohydrolase family protein [Rubrivirga marina]PAP75817.1 amidohydrolase [Rubrivirga marina]
MLRRLASLVLILAAVVAPTCAQDAAVVAFEGVTVVPMDRERTLPGHTVVVRGDRIEAVGPDGSVVVPDGATVIDGRGKWLAPGLAEMHGHVPPPSAPAELTEETLFLYLSQGITTVRGMLGAEGQLDLKRRANTGEVLSPTLYLAGPSFNGNSVSSPEQAEAMVRQQVADGWDLLKVHPGLTRAEYDAMAETANTLGIRFGGHVPAEVGLEHAIASGQETFDHVDGYAEALDASAGPVDPARLGDLVRQSRAAGVWIVPTMALWETIYGALPLDTLRAYPELAYLPPQQVEGWVGTVEQIRSGADYDAEAARRLIEGRDEILRALHAGGVRILMGTDAPQLFSVPGFSLHREFPRMAAAGMSPYEILHSGTALVGEYFADEDTFGVVAPGHRADLVLLDADPLAESANLAEIAGVMARGRWVDRADLDARLDALRSKYASN